MFDFVRYGVYKMMKQDSWAEQYNSNNRFSVDQYAFDTEEDYLEALRNEWLYAVDLPVELEDEIDVHDYTDFDLFEMDVEELIENFDQELDCRYTIEQAKIRLEDM